MMKITSKFAQRRPRRQTQVSPGQAFQQSKNQWEQFFNNPLSGAEGNAQQLAQWTNTTPLPSKQRGPCAVCGQDVPEGQGVIDERGLAGKGNNALLCSQHAYNVGLRRQPATRRRAQFSRGTIKKTGPKQPKTDVEEKPKVPNVWDSFWAGYDHPDISYEDWKKRYWSKNRKPPTKNWLNEWLRRKSKLPG